MASDKRELAQRIIETKKRELSRAIAKRDEQLQKFGYEASIQFHRNVEEIRNALIGMEELFSFVFDSITETTH